MIYLGNNEFIKGYINNLNKVYIGNDLLYWNVKEDNNEEIEKQYDLSFEFTGNSVTFKLNNITYTATSSPYNVNTKDDLGIDSVNSCYAMFENANTVIRITSFPDTSNVTDMGYMFNKCTSLTSLNLNNFDTSNVTNMLQMFFGCSNLTSLDLSIFDTSNVTNMGYMFYNCINLETLNVSGWKIDKISNYSSMFKNCSKLSKLILGNVTDSEYNWWCARLTANGISTSIIERDNNTNKFNFLLK